MIASEERAALSKRMAELNKQLFKDFDVGKSIIGYSQNEVHKALAEMGKKVK